MGPAGGIVPPGASEGNARSSRGLGGPNPGADPAERVGLRDERRPPLRG
jgi:hypothetical protein